MPVGDLWPVVRQRVEALAATSGRLLIVTDFDGTLAQIDPDPMGSRIEPLGRSALRRLSHLEARQPDRLRVVVLSGRAALDVATRVRVGGIGYLGNHGLEGGTLPRGVRAERLEVSGDPELASFADPARALGRAVAAALGQPDWLFVEDKGPSVAFHYRAAPDPDAAQRQIVQALARRSAEHGHAGLERFDGRRIIEFRPAGAGGKGAAVARLLERERPAAVIVLGDDRSDAEAFRAMAAARAAGSLAAGLAIAIHGAAETPREVVEGADLLLETPHQAARVLAMLASTLEREAARTGAMAPPQATRLAVRARALPFCV